MTFAQLLAWIIGEMSFAVIPSFSVLAIIALFGMRMGLKKIRTIAIINGIIASLILFVINNIGMGMGGYSINSTVAVFLWSYIGYRIMKKRCLKSDVQKSDISPDNEYTSESTMHSLSDANNDIAPVGSYNVYGKDIALHPVEHNIDYYTQKQETVTLQEKNIKTKKNKKPIIAIVILSVLMVISIVINIIQLDKYNELIDEYNQLIDEYSTLAIEYNNTCETLNDAKAERDNYKELLNNVIEERDTYKELLEDETSTKYYFEKSYMEEYEELKEEREK